VSKKKRRGAVENVRERERERERERDKMCVARQDVSRIAGLKSRRPGGRLKAGWVDFRLVVFSDRGSLAGDLWWR
jgi:hypothetical protein